jgi:hypothetical protein
LLAITAVTQQVQLVNVIPAMYSNETNTDSEPNVAVNPANPMDVVVTAFTPCPAMISSTDAPLYFSTDGGNTWQLNCILPGNDPTYGTNDVTPRFAGAGGVLYAGILTYNTYLGLDILRTADFTSPVEMTTLVSRNPEDQPYTEAVAYYGDHVYIGNNNLSYSTFFGGSGGKSASIDWSTDAATAPPPAGFTTNVLETRDTCGQDPPPIRPAVQINGTVYAVYYHNQTGSPCFGASNLVDVVVARDDNFGSGGFSAIIDGGDGKAGVRVVQGVSVVWAGAMGNERLQGSQLSIAVDPNDSNTVYVAWADGTSASYTLHVRHSTTGGATWDGSDLKSVSPADNPALAINKDGIVGFLYQKYVSSGTCHTGGGSAACWETHFETYNGSTWTDLPQPLANTPDNVGTFPLGDYEHVMAVGRDFYGAFSASNYPDTANFYTGVQYQRYVDWSSHKLYADAGHTMPVSTSADPFFFHITILQLYQIFYVRDWTDSPSSHDNGEEPSTNGNWWTTGDVWNRITNTNGGINANDQPNSQNAQDHVSVTAHNYAFVRVHRNQAAPSGPDVTVTARFLYADYGLGVPYQDVSASSKAMVTFASADTVQTQPDGAGVQWDLPLMRSTHICLAVEISAPNDVYSPELAGRAPGWPTTDWTIPADNEKAQRNMDLPPMAAASPGTMSFHPIVHNAASFTRDMTLQYSVPADTFERLEGPQIGIVGGELQSMRSKGTLVLQNMHPGENRWLNLTYSASNSQVGQLLPITVKEYFGDAAVNGITVAAQPVPVDQMIASNLTMHRGAFARLDVSFHVPNARAQAEAAAQLLAKGSVSEAQYTSFLNQNLSPIGTIIAALIKGQKANDSFGLVPALANLQNALSSGNGGFIANSHMALLNKLDAFQTMLQKQQGDPADILQMVLWQKRLYSTVPRLTELKAARLVIEESNEFISSYDHPGPHEETYSGMIRELGGAFHETAEALECEKLNLEPLVHDMEHHLKDVGALEKAHRAYLLQLQKLCP